MVAAAALAFLIVTPAPQPTVLREVVYKVTSLTTQSLSRGTFGGYVPNPDAHNNSRMGSSGAFEPAPTSKTAGSHQEGKITIDVLDVVGDVVHVRLAEDFVSRASPYSYEAFVEPNGLVRYNAEAPSSIAEYLLPLFGTRFAASATLANGDSWHIALKTEAVSVDDKFTIMGRDGAVLMLDESGSVKMTSARGMNLDVRGKLKYKPSLLVPISGDVDERGSRSTADTLNQIETNVHFERLSDSLEPVVPK